MVRIIIILALSVIGMNCGEPNSANKADYFATHEKGVQAGNVKMIAIESMGKQFNVWTNFNMSFSGTNLKILSFF